MAWLLGDGFDFYNGVADMTVPGTIWANTSVAATLAGPTRFGVGLSEQFSLNVHLDSISFANSTTVYLNFAHICNAVQSAGNTLGMGFVLYDATTEQIRLGLLQDGSYALMSSVGTVIVAGTRSPANSFIQNVWNHVQAKIVIDPSAGSFELRLNGSATPIVLATGLNTRVSSNSFCNRVQLACTSNVVSGNVDDFYIFNDQGAAPNTWQGDVRAVQQMPSSDFSVTWTPNSGSLRFNRVNELREDADTSYVTTATINAVDQYGLTAITPAPLAIIAVQSKMYARMDDAGPHSVKSRLTSVSATADSATLSLSTSYQWVWQMYTTDPNTSAPWSASNLNAVTIGPFDVV